MSTKIQTQIVLRRLAFCLTLNTSFLHSKFFAAIVGPVLLGRRACQSPAQKSGLPFSHFKEKDSLDVLTCLEVVAVGLHHDIVLVYVCVFVFVCVCVCAKGAKFLKLSLGGP